MYVCCVNANVDSDEDDGDDDDNNDALHAHLLRFRVSPPSVPANLFNFQANIQKKKKKNEERSWR